MSAHHRTAEWSRITRANRPRIRAMLPAPCVNRCVLGGIVHVEDKWDVAHIIDNGRGGDDDPSNLGPAHYRCNRSDGGKLGRAMQITATKTSKRLPTW